VVLCVPVATHGHLPSIATISGSIGLVSVWSLGLLADLEKLRYRFVGPEEFWLISKWRLLPSGKRPDENFG